MAKKLSKTQIEVLERLAKGHFISRHPFWQAEWIGYRSATMDVLLRGGLIIEIPFDPGKYGRKTMCASITDAGLKALAQVQESKHK